VPASSKSLCMQLKLIQCACFPWLPCYVKQRMLCDVLLWWVPNSKPLSVRCSSCICVPVENHGRWWRTQAGYDIVQDPSNQCLLHRLPYFLAGWTCSDVARRQSWLVLPDRCNLQHADGSTINLWRGLPATPAFCTAVQGETLAHTVMTNAVHQ
jgi:hypothetical protein